jgi:hypothetical protein
VASEGQVLNRRRARFRVSKLAPHLAGAARDLRKGYSQGVLRVLALGAVACGAPTTTISNRGGTPTNPPDLDALRALVTQHSDADFDADARGRGCPSYVTLGFYANQLVDRPTKHAIRHLHGGCGAFPDVPWTFDPPRDPAYWFCTVAYDVGDVSPRHYELHLRVRIVDAALDLRTIACPY